MRSKKGSGYFYGIVGRQQNIRAAHHGMECCQNVGAAVYGSPFAVAGAGGQCVDAGMRGSVGRGSGRYRSGNRSSPEGSE